VEKHRGFFKRDITINKRKEVLIVDLIVLAEINIPKNGKIIE
jgi:hypothetical protein